MRQSRLLTKCNEQQVLWTSFHLGHQHNPLLAPECDVLLKMTVCMVQGAHCSVQCAWDNLSTAKCRGTVCSVQSTHTLCGAPNMQCVISRVHSVHCAVCRIHSVQCAECSA